MGAKGRIKVYNPATIQLCCNNIVRSMVAVAESFLLILLFRSTNVFPPNYLSLLDVQGSLFRLQCWISHENGPKMLLSGDASTMLGATVNYDL
jgi:hypothetical protein